MSQEKIEIGFDGLDEVVFRGYVLDYWNGWVVPGILEKDIERVLHEVINMAWLDDDAEVKDYKKKGDKFELYDIKGNLTGELEPEKYKGEKVYRFDFGTTWEEK